MEHGAAPEVLALLAACIVLWGALGALLERYDVSAPRLAAVNPHPHP